MLLFCLTCETISTHRQIMSSNSRPQVNTRSMHPQDHTSEMLTHTWLVPELTPVRHQLVTPGARRQSVHQSHLRQSHGPPSCPTSQLRYWQPKGLPVPPITPAPRLGRTPMSATPSQYVLLGDARAPNPAGVGVE